MLSRVATVIRAITLGSLIALNGSASAQTPGEWRYTITTDLSNIPADMRVNFPKISFSVCRSAEDFANGAAFALQTLASSTARCPSTDFERSAVARMVPGHTAADTPDGIRFRYACDGGKTLEGSAQGRASAKRFEINLDSRYIPATSGVERVRQQMSGFYVGPCKAKPDADAMKVK
jgi:hypothetical protein